MIIYIRPFLSGATVRADMNPCTFHDFALFVHKEFELTEPLPTIRRVGLWRSRSRSDVSVRLDLADGVRKTLAGEDRFETHVPPGEVIKVTLDTPNYVHEYAIKWEVPYGEK